MFEQEHFLARQSILDPEGAIFGYELLFRAGAASQSADFESEQQAGMSVLGHALGNFGQQWLLGDKVAFINVADGTLKRNAEFLALLDPAKTVFEIVPFTKVDARLVERVAALRAQGFSFCLDGCVLDPAFAPLMPHCQWVKVDCLRAGREGARAEADAARCAMPWAKIICSKIEDEATRDFAKTLGPALYQGFYFEKPQTLRAKTLSGNVAAIAKAISLVRRNSDIGPIEEALKKDVASSIKLLRYINSAGFGLKTEVSSYRHAIQLLGYERLSRWLMLLLATSAPNTPSALAVTAIARGRFMEIVGAGSMGPEDADALFLTGVFSLVDALLGVSSEEALGDLGLPEPTREALWDQSGPHYPLLMLAISLERDWPEKTRDLLAELGVSPVAANRALLEATLWAQGLVS